MELVRDKLRPEFIAEFEQWAGEKAKPILDEPLPLDVRVAEILRPGLEVRFYGAPLYAIARALKPTVVVETGICSGCSTRCILAALDANDHGDLYSIDVEPLRPFYYTSIGELQKQLGVDGVSRAPIDYTHRWHHAEWRGDTMLKLPELLRHVGGVDLYWHDTGSEAKRLHYELSRARAVARPGAILAHHDDFNQWDRSVLGDVRQVFGLTEPKIHFVGTRFEHSLRNTYHNVLRGWEVP